ncbi:Clp protease N-terminal domain-containing protein [Gordonia sp. ABSL1-1]|uniref:Clp protease N-terminal domain-containing protein n=1 Tax=Gordonia sp. ABSL1-1 TaxID=3053923 RepID=UPI0025727A02|nr:Clp protease N-terminal domain-containing protein [Gordonia sp. ABSL1-1]MDL9936066.1 Clp protease N-terminal domain-containing protein [Gordonia sp. ABSL1-1]
MFERFNREDRMLVAFATQEAADLEHRSLGNDHLILGMLCNARSPLFAVLGEQGLTLAGARAACRSYHDENVASDPDADEEASARQRYDEDREALRGIGIDLDRLRAAVRDRFGEDLSEGWGERDSRGRGRRGGPEGCGPHGRRRGHGHPHGRRGPRRGDAPFGGPMEFGGPPMFGRPGDGPADGPVGPWDAGRGRRGPRGRGSRPRFAPETRSAFERAVMIARERGDNRLRVEYLLLGILDSADEAARAVIESATTADDLRAAVVAALPPVDAAV